jgi:hypothetical protein
VKLLRAHVAYFLDGTRQGHHPDVAGLLESFDFGRRRKFRRKIEHRSGVTGGLDFDIGE